MKIPDQGKPRLSVLVPAYDAEAHIDAALASIAAALEALAKPIAAEVIVVDDGSSDDTAARVAAHPWVRCICQSNQGPAAARNLGLGLARGELIAFLDADDLWTPQALNVLIGLLDSQPQAGLAFGDCRLFDAQGERPSTQFETQGLDAAFFGDPLRVLDPYAKLLRLNFIPTGAVLARRPCIRSAGGFDPARRRVEDLDLWLRMALHCPFVYSTQVCELKRAHGAGLSVDQEAMTLAYIDVLESQARVRPEELTRRGIRLAPRLAQEYALVGDQRERRGDRPGARHAYLAALRQGQSLRPAFYWARSWLPGYRPPTARHRADG